MRFMGHIWIAKREAPRLSILARGFARGLASGLARAAALVSLLLGAGCQAGPAVVAVAGPVPPEAFQLQCQVYLDGASALPLPRIPYAALQGRTQVSLGLRLPVGAAGRLVVDSVALDLRGCAVAGGVGVTALTAGSEQLYQVPVELVPLPAPDCGAGPALDRAAPQVVGEGDVITLTGRAIQPGAQVLVAGQQAAPVEWRSPREITAAAPALSGALGPVPVAVRNPDGGLAQLDGAVYYLRHSRLLPPLMTPLPAPVVAAALADLNRDGFADLVAVSAPPPGQQGLISVLLGSSQDAPTPFLPFAALHRDSTTPAAIAVADVDLDARPDLVLLEQDLAAKVCRLVILRGRGDGRLEDGGDAYPCGAEAAIPGASLAVADMDSDGWPDVILGQSWLQGRGAGVFFQAVQLAYVTQAHTVLVQDQNRDRLPDLAILGTESGTPPPGDLAFDDLTYLENRGGGRLVDPVTGSDTRRIAYPAGTSCAAVASADLDRDGTDDLLVPCTADHALNFFRRGPAGLRLTRRYPLGADFYPSAVQVRDVNQDGWPDALLAEARDGRLGVLLSPGGDARPTRLETYPALPFPGQLLVRPANGARPQALVVVGRGGVALVRSALAGEP